MHDHYTASVNVVSENIIKTKREKEKKIFIIIFLFF